MVFCAQYTILGERVPGTLAEADRCAGHELLSQTVRTVRGMLPGLLGWRPRLPSGCSTAPDSNLHETVLVVGVGGGVSSAAALIGKAIGARVLVTSRRAGRRSTGRSDTVPRLVSIRLLNSRRTSKKLTGRGAEVVVENVGKATWDQSFRSLAPGGRMVICGATAGNKVELSLPVLWFKQLEIIGSTMANRSQFADDS